MLDLNPSFTAIPNDFLDQLAPTLTAAELRVALYIYRHTIGYQKLTDTISYSQFTDGITTADGRKLDAGAGISRRSLPVALAGLEKRGVISRSSGTLGAVRYTIVLRPVQASPVSVAKIKEPTPASQNFTEPTPPSVPALDPVPKLPVPAQPGQNLPSRQPQAGQNLHHTKQTDSKIKSDRAAEAAVKIILEEIAGITPNQAQKLVETAEQNQRDISYIQRLVGYVSSVAGNPAAMLTTLIKTNQDRTTSTTGHSASYTNTNNRHRSKLPGYDWTLKKSTSHQPIDFSKPFYQRLIALAESNLAFDSNSNLIEAPTTILQETGLEPEL